jgi:hypothetical protein
MNESPNKPVEPGKKEIPAFLQRPEVTVTVQDEATKGEAGVPAKN